MKTILVGIYRCVKLLLILIGLIHIYGVEKTFRNWIFGPPEYVGDPSSKLGYDMDTGEFFRKDGTILRNVQQFENKSPGKTRVKKWWGTKPSDFPAQPPLPGYRWGMRYGESWRMEKGSCLDKDSPPNCVE